VVDETSYLGENDASEVLSAKNAHYSPLHTATVEILGVRMSK
jgi:hypothetical protein